MKVTHDSLARKARPLLVVTSLITGIALAFPPGVPVAVAFSASTDPSAEAPSLAPDQSPAPDPTQLAPPDPTPSPAADPTAGPAEPPSPVPTPAPESAPVPSSGPPPDTTPGPGPTPGPDASPTPPPWPAAPPTAAPAGSPVVPLAASFDASRPQFAVASDPSRFELRTFTIETWFLRRGPVTGEPDGGGGVGTTTGPGGIASAIPLVTRGAADPRRSAGEPVAPTDRIAWFVGIDEAAHVLVADFQDAATGANHPIAGTTRLEDGTWHHVAATYDGTAWRLFLDGRLEAEQFVGDVDPASMSSAPVALATSMASDAATARGAFDGLLDETRIWRVARSAAEIRLGLNAPVTSDAPDLVAAWTMDDADASTAPDIALPGVRLTFTPGATLVDSPIPDATVPAAPTGVVAEAGTSSVAVAWAAVTDPDVAGYNIYRGTTSPVSTDGEPLNGPLPIRASAYLDATAAPGVDIRYVVTTVDMHANESPPSGEASVRLLAPTTPADPIAGPEVAVERVMLGHVDPLSLAASYLPGDEPVVGAQRFETYRIRFRVRNARDVPVVIAPRLESRAAADAAFTIVPALDTQAGLPFYVAQEWTEVAGVDGTTLGPVGEPIEVAELRMARVGDVLQPAPGHHSMGPNPAPPLALPAHAWTEVEFSVRATVDAPYLAAFEFRLTDGGLDLSGPSTATIRLGPEPPPVTSPGQRQGAPVGGSSGSVDARTVSYPLSASAAGAPRQTTRYGLVAVGTSSSPEPAGAAATLDQDPAHGPFAGSTDACALCHGTHSGQGPSLLRDTAPQANLCFRCHDSAGTGAATLVQAQYTDPAVPPNDPATGSYFRHDALATGSGHSQAQIDEFGGRLDRHSECGDCHDAHAASSAESVQTTDGWTAPGQLDGVSGVAVANGTAGTAPTYTFLDGTRAPVTLEYQLCLKCHSGSTTLPAKQIDKPSYWALDKGIELNPANTSLHPIEAAGRNTTAAMSNSLAGTSPYKLWNFTVGSTIRCVNCHGDPAKVGSSAPAAGSDLAPHAVATVVAPDGTQLNRGLLLLPYRDRTLKGPADTYTALDSALCLACHKEAPFADVSGNPRTDTNFRLHGKHVASLRNEGAGLGDIDTAGAGRGNAICSECHYRIHSTATRNDFRTVTLQTGTDGGLVIFAPNVIGTGTPSAIDWTRSGANGGTCTLRCHGKGHTAEPY